MPVLRNLLAASLQRLMRPHALAAAGFALIGVAIICNALFLQSRRHPSPFVWTHHDAEPARPAGDPLVLSVQQALKDADAFAGPVDGLIGPRTRAAIFDFEERLGRPGTGEPSLDLLRAVHAAAAEHTGSVSSADTPQPQAAAGPQPMPAQSPSQPVPSESAEAPDPMVVAVQEALARSGYGPLTVDGFAGDATREAIGRFQSDHGIEATGEISESLVIELRAAGAIEAN